MHANLARNAPQILAAALLCAVAPSALADDDAPAGPGTDSLAPVLWQDSLNVFRRFAVDESKMFEFYGDVLGLKAMATLNVGGGTQVARYQVGSSQVKLTRKVPDRTYQPGGPRQATGVRLLTFFFPDEPALTARFRAHGYPIPEFHAVPGSARKMALTTDPDGQSVELVVAPGEPAATYEHIEIGLTVSDIDASRDFYRNFAGLDPQPPRADRVFDTTVYPFRHGSTVVNLRSFGASLPADTGSGGIQYVVSDVDRVDALAKAKHVTVEQPLSTLAGFSLRTIWLNDPDGITNYFAETAASRRGGEH
jgi:catechol 2,3-dioxygenase-like lactoylglutathione lyase family enzyme